MTQSVIRKNYSKVVLQQWRFKQTVELEQQKLELKREKEQIELEKRGLERQKKEFTIQQQREERRMEQEKQLFEMKWKVLEAELRKLADEKQQIARQKDFYRCVDEYEHRELKGEMFFTGVGNEGALKRRYKDLIKIYHPDNLDGDTGTIQEINREYDRLKEAYGI